MKLIHHLLNLCKIKSLSPETTRTIFTLSQWLQFQPGMEWIQVQFKERLIKHTRRQNSTIMQISRQ